MIHFNSPAVCKMCWLFCNILLIGGLYVIINGMTFSVFLGVSVMPNS